MTRFALKTQAIAVAMAALCVAARSAYAQHDHGHGKAATPASGMPSNRGAGDSDSTVMAGTEHVMNNDMAAGLHMEMTPSRPANRADSVRAARLVTELRAGIAKYKDVNVAIEEGYKQFAPGVKGQKVLHFTNNRSAVRSAFSFNPAKPTSLLYRPVEGGKLVLIGAMYTAPKRASLEDLDERVPLSVAKWHKHTNLCVPPRRERERWKEMKDGKPVFGPLSPIATEEECDKVGGKFHSQVFGWMVHANVFASDDPRVIWGDDHGG